MYDVYTFIFHSYSKPNLGMQQTSLAYKTCCFEDIKLLNNNLLNIHLFRNDSHTARMQLAAVDHNYHLYRNPSLTKHGNKKYRKTFNKRSKNYKVTTVLEEKTYPYWKTLACRIMDKRVADTETVLRKVDVSDDHPKKISSSISLKTIPKTGKLVKGLLSRFEKS